MRDLELVFAQYPTTGQSDIDWIEKEINRYACISGREASQGNDLASVLDPGYQREDGYIALENGDYVTWCHGHLLSLAEPDYYDLALKRWDIRTLPFIPHEFEWLPVSDKRSRKQLKIACDLIVKADEVVVSTDFDREGQLIAMNVLNHCNFSGDTYRLKLSRLIRHQLEKHLIALSLYQKLMLYMKVRSHDHTQIGLSA